MVEVFLTIDSVGVPQVHVLIDRDSDGRAEETRLLIGGLDHPNGVTWLGGALYVMTDTLLLRYDNIDTYAMSGEVRTHDCKLDGVSGNSHETVTAVVALHLSFASEAISCSRMGAGYSIAS